MYILNSELLKNIAIKTKFLKKDSKFTPEKFISLCVFSNNHLCGNTLEELSTWLRTNENLSITKQGINDSFNDSSVEFGSCTVVDAGEGDFAYIPKLENNVGK